MKHKDSLKVQLSQYQIDWSKYKIVIYDYPWHHRGGRIDFIPNNPSERIIRDDLSWVDVDHQMYSIAMDGLHPGDLEWVKSAFEIIGQNSNV